MHCENSQEERRTAMRILALFALPLAADLPETDATGRGPYSARSESGWKVGQAGRRSYRAKGGASVAASAVELESGWRCSGAVEAGLDLVQGVRRYRRLPAHRRESKQHIQAGHNQRPAEQSRRCHPSDGMLAPLCLRNRGPFTLRSRRQGAGTQARQPALHDISGVSATRAPRNPTSKPNTR